MADEKHEESEQPVEEEIVETYYDDEDGHSETTGFSWKSGASVTGTACAAADEACDRVLKTVPADVTDHLINSHNELLKAGVALLNNAIGKAEDVRERSHKAHGEPEDAAS